MKVATSIITFSVLEITATIAAIPPVRNDRLNVKPLLLRQALQVRKMQEPTSHAIENAPISSANEALFKTQ